MYLFTKARYFAFPSRTESLTREPDRSTHFPITHETRLVCSHVTFTLSCCRTDQSGTLKTVKNIALVRNNLPPLFKHFEKCSAVSSFEAVLISRTIFSRSEVSSCQDVERRLPRQRPVPKRAPQELGCSFPSAEFTVFFAKVRLLRCCILTMATESRNRTTFKCRQDHQSEARTI